MTTETKKTINPLDFLPKEYKPDNVNYGEIKCIEGVRATRINPDAVSLMTAKDERLIPAIHSSKEPNGIKYLVDEDLFIKDNDGHLFVGGMQIFIESIEHWKDRLKKEQQKAINELIELTGGQSMAEGIPVIDSK